MSLHVSWTLASAKARLSEVLERAQHLPQIVTRRGKPVAVVVSIAEWDRRTKRRGSLSEFFQHSPLRGSDIDLERIADEPRDVELS